MAHLLQLYLQGVTFEPKSQRDYCIKELVETERNYVEALNMIMSVSLSELSWSFWDEKTKTWNTTFHNMNIDSEVNTENIFGRENKSLTNYETILFYFCIFRFSTLLDHYEQSCLRKPIKWYFLE